jgi:hypothetical protein
VGMLLDIVVLRLGRGLDLYEETDRRKARGGSRNSISQQLKRQLIL